VSPAGLITGVGPGTATITAEVEGKTGTTAIQISLIPVATVTVNPASQTVSAGATVPFTVTLKDSADHVITGRQVTWTVVNTNIASVSQAGVATGILVGTTQVIATIEGKQGSAALTVNTLTTPVSTITLSPQSASMSGGATKQLTPTLRDASGNLIEGRQITWTSSNTSLATVSSAGLVTTAPGNGSVTITASIEGKTATASFDVFTFTRMSAGSEFSCALREDGTAYCWGKNNFGQLGDGTTTPSAKLLPTKVLTNVRFLTIASGQSTTCGIGEDGFTYCWGWNAGGMLGNGSTTAEFSATPEQIVGGYKFVSVAVGSNTTCATTADGDVYCWGLYGEDFPDNPNGNGPFSKSRPVPTRIGGGMVAVVGGLDNRFCSVDFTGIAYCWSVIYSTAYATGAVTPPIREPVSTSLHFTTLRVGSGHACGLVASGEAYCWGRNDLGQLGDGTTTTRTTPAPVAGGLTFQSLAAGGGFVSADGIAGLTGGYSCGLTTAGKAYCWGTNVAGQLGIGAPSNAVLTPQPVLGNLLFTGLRAGTAHMCGLAVGGPAYCWGSNQFGSLANGTTTPASQPTLIFAP
jgi:alpha-tubulin suppressor-like RCC1 family protein